MENAMNFIEPAQTAPRMYSKFQEFTTEEQSYIRDKFSKNGDVEKSFFRRVPNKKKISISMYAGSLSF